MKYFFLSDGWTTGRVWEFGGLWNEIAWQRKPIMNRLSLYIEEATEKLWLYQVEDDVLMVEVLAEGETATPIGQVVLKRLITADQVIEKLCSSNAAVTTNPELAAVARQQDSPL
ncbi:hypothetical protein [Leptothoe sp. PORK10 BA2]|uniref:hypothetical protein n=1 Tax=Leptothoe sp. PORK10 BA2 TaxID=3110254 RepID=UPI002B20D927|nr:hypothetical protein [Leptothoe sp. PORK10 BA2]MEA5462194.1 hypothetical protein [Leptothoe sp. PORK10 BA2]